MLSRSFVRTQAIGRKVTVPYWRLSSFYFFYFATLGGFFPFWGLYLEHLAFNATEIGELSALMVATKIIAPNICGWMADYTGKSLRIIKIISFLAALIFAGFFYDSSYLWVAIITIGFSFFWNATLPQFEAETVSHLQEEPHRYSQIRLWGSIGFIVSVLGIGWLVDLYSIAYLPKWLIVFLIMIWWVSLVTPEARTALPEKTNIRLSKIIKQPEIIAFFAVYALIQASHAPYYVFYSIYLQPFNYSSTSIGLLWALGVGAEVLLLMLMKPLLKWFSLRHILYISIISGVCRWLLIAFFADYFVLILLAQLLHATTFGASHVVAIYLLQQYFGHHQGKGQALYSSLTFGVGGMVGGLCSGYFWDLYQPYVIFVMASACCVIAFVLTFIWIGRVNQTTRHC